MEQKPLLNLPDLRVDNLNQYISDTHNGEFKNFYTEFKDKLISKLQLTEEESESKVKQLRNAMAKYEGKAFSKTLQNLVERCFELPSGILAQNRSFREPAYILVSCAGNSSNLLFNKITTFEIVDEVSVLFGDMDLYIKVYATKKQIQKFVTEDLYNIKGVTINYTKTYLSMEERVWARYPVGNHPNYAPPANRWS